MPHPWNSEKGREDSLKPILQKQKNKIVVPDSNRWVPASTLFLENYRLSPRLSPLPTISWLFGFNHSLHSFKMSWQIQHCFWKIFMSIITANNFAAVMIFLEVASDRCWLQKAEERRGGNSSSWVIIWVIICRLYIYIYPGVYSSDIYAFVCLPCMSKYILHKTIKSTKNLSGLECKIEFKPGFC